MAYTATCRTSTPRFLIAFGPFVVLQALYGALSLKSGMRPTIGTAEEIADFSPTFPHSIILPGTNLLHVAAAVAVRSFPAGTDILIEDGPPANELYIIRKGSIELRHQDEVVDILEPGETFGHPSLLTGLTAAFTVRAHVDTTCYIISREPALGILGRPAGAYSLRGLCVSGSPALGILSMACRRFARSASAIS